MDEALAAFSRAAAVDSTNATAYYLIGVLSLKGGKEGMAERALINSARLGMREARDYLDARGIRW
jgi:hypothetical protein